jgi:hypothetical protein
MNEARNWPECEFDPDRAFPLARDMLADLPDLRSHPTSECPASLSDDRNAGKGMVRIAAGWSPLILWFADEEAQARQHHRPTPAARQKTARIGCAKSSGEIRPSYVSPLQYQS